MERLGWTEEQLKAVNIHAIHPSFRMIALAEPPLEGQRSWLTDELQSMFHFHTVRPLQLAEERQVLSALGEWKEITNLHKLGYHCNTPANHGTARHGTEQSCSSAKQRVALHSTLENENLQCTCYVHARRNVLFVPDLQPHLHCTRCAKCGSYYMILTVMSSPLPPRPLSLQPSSHTHIHT